MWPVIQLPYDSITYTFRVPADIAHSSPLAHLQPRCAGHDVRPLGRTAAVLQADNLFLRLQVPYRRVARRRGRGKHARDGGVPLELGDLIQLVRGGYVRDGC